MISLKGINKKFYLGALNNNSSLGGLLSIFSGREKKQVHQVLQDINFVFEPGKITGIIGRNGSGKSTLLRIIAGIYQADEGEVKVRGRMIYLTGFGQGLMPKLTMKENIFLIGSLLGLRHREIAQKMNDIVEFSELGQYLNTKVYQFSSGMIGRLSFSSTILCVRHHQPDVILIDEALDAGADLNFQNKAINKVEEMIKSGATVVLVSHNLETVQKYCDQVIWLDQGKIVEAGLAASVIEKYIEANK